MAILGTVWSCRGKADIGEITKTKDKFKMVKMFKNVVYFIGIGMVILFLAWVACIFSRSVQFLTFASVILLCFGSMFLSVGLVILYDCICDFLSVMDKFRIMLTSGFTFTYTVGDKRDDI